MLRTRVVLAVVCAGVALSPGQLYAQGSPTGLLAAMYRLFVDRVALARTPGGRGVVAHDPVFVNDPRVSSVAALVQQVSQQIGSQISTFPLGSSSGGFTYRYDPSLGTFARSTNTFGPAFGERAVTVGRQKLSVGMNYVHATYDTLDGKDLGKGDIKFYLFHQPLTPPSFAEGDVIQAALQMKLTSDTAAFYANYGVTDQLDIGLSVPVVRVTMDVTYRATILDFATANVSPTTHLFGNRTKTEDFAAEGSASGIGDVVVRAKYNFLKREAGGFAVGLDLRLPTGDDQNMLGTGTNQTQIFFIGSATAGRVSPHVNVGYTVSSGGTGSSDQFNYVGGAEFAVAPKLTLAGDVVGRTFGDALRLKDVSLPHSFRQGATAPIETTTLESVAAVSGSLTSVFGAAGVKFNPWQNLLISGHVLFGLSDAGLRSRVTPVIGFEYSF